MVGTFALEGCKYQITTSSSRNLPRTLGKKFGSSAICKDPTLCNRPLSTSTACTSSKGKSVFFGSNCNYKRRSPGTFCESFHTRLPIMVSASNSTSQAVIPLLRNLLSGIVKPYLEKNPTAVTALQLIRKEDPGPVCYDHFAFRTFGVDGCGIDSIAQVFLDLGYKTRDELRFPAKKLRALWFSPPEHLYGVAGELENGPVPRIFISELLVDQLSEKSQSIIRKYTKDATQCARHAAAASVLNSLTWPTPSFADYQHLASESEYAAWTLVNGYSLNHATVSVHRLSQMCHISKLNEFLQEHGIKLNSEGGITKVSPDGGLQQSSSVADSVQYAFADGEVKKVPGSYIEFAERLVLPVFSSLSDEQIQECHRREGFEVGNADKIFESTSSDQMSLKG
ncbi:hypothetical protein MPTK1_3g14320 [Marchantia polymorpha subsp. ruderalis]|uniref:2-oxoadipate dioxygenase/decarboxylase n=2 Tax=Marchantia polymorpha TaxID=3197 RepID=A0A176WEH0_MARPO|nr:hypothetical protein AXG93_3128s1160 [Marchantia polymorpha subsp. ruderalis]PTQ49003.1 hypothetical protein MARPO_0004s0239 [Marchantia polymorpha]PTQ49004.1 hypothetical protein MARPO_0004s0239 [Marchantia polymorpha]PTQ49005.1 hypothetical protein MARPO_0004s0239 [Marchantia polymorpha]PTQ49006.1 hypothetical protein MARPO_0004s0239 [Marchantia polymorpha]|eukprot:PTQ49003.1 hypothetical protein MARPO_0004s0239 [Marchantia polymorpha]